MPYTEKPAQKQGAGKGVEGELVGFLWWGEKPCDRATRFYSGWSQKAQKQGKKKKKNFGGKVEKSLLMI